MKELKAKIARFIRLSSVQTFIDAETQQVLRLASYVKRGNALKDVLEFETEKKVSHGAKCRDRKQI